MDVRERRGVKSGQAVISIVEDLGTIRASGTCTAMRAETRRGHIQHVGFEVRSGHRGYVDIRSRVDYPGQRGSSPSSKPFIAEMEYLRPCCDEASLFEFSRNRENYCWS